MNESTRGGGAAAIPMVYGFPRDTDRYRLSNFFEGGGFDFYGYRCATGEAAFHLPKSKDPEFRRRMAETLTGMQAKGLGRAVKLRPDWEEPSDGVALCDRVMLHVVRARIKGERGFADYLLSTYPSVLVEANGHGDRKWGADQRTGMGENRLGIIEMVARDEFRSVSLGTAVDLAAGEAALTLLRVAEDWSPRAFAAGRIPRAMERFAFFARSRERGSDGEMTRQRDERDR